MRVTVQYFGMLQELAGRAGESVDLPDGAVLGSLYDLLKQQSPGLAGFQRSIALAVNCEYSDPNRPLRDGDEVALIPPVSGGALETKSSTTATQHADHAALVSQAIDSDAIAKAIKQPEDGAVVVFDGIVRNNTRGRRTLYLEYTAYEAMALKQMEELATQALERFAVRDVWLVHRLGRLEIGETSVLIAVASAHRAAAFEACRWAIDTLKKRVPIWKKEFFEDGAVWADGEAFPSEVPVSGGDASKSSGQG
jgi:molybdopterin synthase catalytic subunit